MCGHRREAGESAFFVHACVSMCGHRSEARESVFYVGEHGTGPESVHFVSECGLGVILSPHFVLSKGKLFSYTETSKYILIPVYVLYLRTWIF